MRFLPLLLTVFIDSLGFGLALPIFSPLIMSPEQSILAFETSLSMRGWIFGLLISAFCVGQFFGGPILGALSDRMGRKKILFISLGIAALTYIVGGVGILEGSVTLLLLARLFSGCAQSNWTIAQSIIVDLSTEEEKTKNFGLLGMAWGSGFVIGPFLGGHLSNPSLIPGADLATPFWIASGLSVLNIFLLMGRLDESLPKNQFAKVSWLAGIEHLKKAFTTPKLRSVFAMMFVFSFGWGFFTEFCPIFLIQHLNYDLGDIANFFAYVGLWVALGQGLLIRPFLKRFTPQFLLPASLLGMAIVLPMMLLVNEAWGVFLILPFLSFFESMIFPNASTLVSNLSDKEAQGEVLGIHNSVQWAAIGFAPLFTGSAVALIPHLPITVAMGAMLVALFIFLKAFKKKQPVVEQVERE
ncbi:MAG: MFS transporter [Candidatus Melainabacteria bacterium]|nr:MFS transporter [Candidatus Melainabacteria bacterium]